MKKIYFVIAALAGLMLASCTKTDVAISNSENYPITYQAIQTAVSTKALGSNKEFATDKSFGSYAFMTAAGKTWSSNASTSQLYINNAKIEYFTDAQDVNGVTMSAASWHENNKVNYWPKQGALTFFAYTPYADAAVTCSNTTGIVAADYDVDATANINKDFMVADIAADKTTNAVSYLKNGVPTLFRHKLCTVGFTIKTDRDYAPKFGTVTAGNYEAGDKLYELTSITIKNVSSKATFTQGIAAPASAGVWASYGTADKKYSIYTAPATPLVINSSAQGAKTLTQNTFIPQVFTTGATSDAVVEVVYTIKTFTAAGNGTDASTFAKETVTETKKLYDLQSGFSYAWGMNKAITYNLTIGADIIYWDPAVVDWESESHDIDLTH